MKIARRFIFFIHHIDEHHKLTGQDPPSNLALKKACRPIHSYFLEISNEWMKDDVTNVTSVGDIHRNNFLARAHSCMSAFASKIPIIAIFFRIFSFPALRHACWRHNSVSWRIANRDMVVLSESVPVSSQENPLEASPVFSPVLKCKSLPVPSVNPPVSSKCESSPVHDVI